MSALLTMIFIHLIAVVIGRHYRQPGAGAFSILAILALLQVAAIMFDLYTLETPEP